MPTDDDSAQQYAPRQFSLAVLLSFVLACAIYFGVLSVTFGSGGPSADSTGAGALLDIDRDYPWRLISTIVISWGGLLALYRYWKLKAAFVIHYTGPVAFGILALVALVISIPVYAFKESMRVFLYLLLYGPFISVLFGFPVVVVMLVYRGLKRG